VSPVRYVLGFYILEDDIHHSRRCKDKSSKTIDCLHGFISFLLHVPVHLTHHQAVIINTYTHYRYVLISILGVICHDCLMIAQSMGQNVTETKQDQCKHPVQICYEELCLLGCYAVSLVRTYVSEELSASFIRVTKIGAIGTTLAVTSSRRTLRGNTK
jgi:hypothetical protein